MWGDEESSGEQRWHLKLAESDQLNETTSDKDITVEFLKEFGSYLINIIYILHHKMAENYAIIFHQVIKGGVGWIEGPPG